ncbi:MAG: HDOD domain-containing protein [Proteobacteria bacterium]|nr:MAG: HDOD domain-containing protein [Pseudomonadota bacterium]
MKGESDMAISDYVKKANELFALPETALRVQEILNDDQSSLADVADVIAIDPNLTSMLLKMANSAFYNFPSKVDTASRAINIMGSEAVFNLVLASSTVDCFRNVPEDVIDLNSFWRRSVDCALICKELGVRINSRNQERFFVIGLLHNLGELICASQTPELAKECASPAENLRPWELQRSKLGFTYARLSSELMKSWRLPAEIYNTIGNQHTPENSAFPVEARILCLSSRIAFYLSLQDDIDLGDQGYIDLANQLNLTPDDIQGAIEFANIEAITVLSILNPTAGVIF